MGKKKTKKCPACSSRLEMPKEYLDATSKIRKEVEKARDLHLTDFVVNDFEAALKRRMEDVVFISPYSSKEIEEVFLSGIRDALEIAKQLTRI